MSDSKHIDEKKLKEMHETQGRKSCFWKHPYGKSKESELCISTSEYDTHACHYLMNSFKAARNREDIHNKRHGKTNRERAIEKSYMKKDTSKTATVNKDTDYYRKAVGDVAREKHEPTFESRFQAKYKKSLFWLVLNEEGWDVQFRIPPQDAEKNMQDIYRRRRQKDAQGNVQHMYVEDSFAPEVRKLYSKFSTGPENFAITKSQAHKGLGAWYPYDHEHHHLISADAFQQFILNVPSPEGWTYMQRAAVVMQAGWNIHNEDNLLMLPSETYAADILDLPAHCPWEVPDHPQYTRDLESWLSPVQQKVDQALLETKNDPEHKITDVMATEIRTLLMNISINSRKTILKNGAKIALG